MIIDGTIFIDLEWPLPQISRSRHYLMLNISETVRGTDIVLFRMTLSDLEWLSEIFNDTKHCVVSATAKLLVVSCWLCDKWKIWSNVPVMQMSGCITLHILAYVYVSPIYYICMLTCSWCSVCCSSAVRSALLRLAHSTGQVSDADYLWLVLPELAAENCWNFQTHVSTIFNHRFWVLSSATKTD